MATSGGLKIQSLVSPEKKIKAGEHRLIDAPDPIWIAGDPLFIEGPDPIWIARSFDTFSPHIYHKDGAWSYPVFNKDYQNSENNKIDTKKKSDLINESDPSFIARKKSHKINSIIKNIQIKKIFDYNHQINKQKKWKPERIIRLFSKQTGFLEHHFKNSTLIFDNNSFSATRMQKMQNISLVNSEVIKKDHDILWLFYTQPDIFEYEFLKSFPHPIIKKIITEIEKPLIYLIYNQIAQVQNLNSDKRTKNKTNESEKISNQYTLPEANIKKFNDSFYLSNFGILESPKKTNKIKWKNQLFKGRTKQFIDHFQSSVPQIHSCDIAGRGVMKIFPWFYVSRTRKKPWAPDTFFAWNAKKDVRDGDQQQVADPLVCFARPKKEAKIYIKFIQNLPTSKSKISQQYKQEDLKFSDKKFDQKIFFNSIFSTSYNLYNATLRVHPIFSLLLRRITTSVFVRFHSPANREKNVGDLRSSSNKILSCIGKNFQFMNLWILKILSKTLIKKPNMQTRLFQLFNLETRSGISQEFDNKEIDCDSKTRPANQIMWYRGTGHNWIVVSRIDSTNKTLFSPTNYDDFQSAQYWICAG